MRLKGEHQRFLRDVFGIGVVAQRGERGPIDRAAMALDQLAEGGGIAARTCSTRSPSVILRLCSG